MFNPVDKSEYELWSWRLILCLLCSFWAARSRGSALWALWCFTRSFSLCVLLPFSQLPSFLSIFLPIYFEFISNRNAYLHSPESVLHFPSSSWYFLKFLKKIERRKTERQRHTSSIFFRFFSFLLVNLPPNFSLFQTGVHSLESVLRIPSASCFSEFFWNKDRRRERALLLHNRLVSVCSPVWYD